MRFLYSSSRLVRDIVEGSFVLNRTRTTLGSIVIQDLSKRLFDFIKVSGRISVDTFRLKDPAQKLREATFIF